MVFGQSGLTGDQTKEQPAAGAKPARPVPPPTPPVPQPQPQPTPPPEQEPAVNTQLPPALPPVPIPDFVPEPPVPPQPPVPERPQRQTTPTRTPPRTTPPQPTRQARNPFANPMDSSFSEAPGPHIARRGRPGGSGAPIDMSLGPLVRNGHLNTPYATVGTIKGVSDDYGAMIDNWIRRHLYYPPEAAQKGQDGPSHVHVVLDRSGQVKSVRLVDSSGSFLLDDATTGMFRNAKLPPVPDDMQGDHFDIDLTVNYILVR
ncbi:MAG: energy transducer TonB [Gluconacetobacter diazotrophicus]|nr:energy transducer TonB [Gluconacetobacter diazotrophicus]